MHYVMGAKKSRYRENFRRGARVALVALVGFLLFAVVGFAAAKGPIPAQPPITIAIYSQNGSDIIPSKQQLATLGSFIQSIPQIFNSTWRQDIQDASAKGGQSISGQWVSQIRLTVDSQWTGNNLFNVYVSVISNGSENDKLHFTYPVDSQLGQTLTTLNASFDMTFAVTGHAFTPDAVQEFFFMVNPYFANLGGLGSQIKGYTDGLAGKSFSWLDISLLDWNVVLVNAGNSTGIVLAQYFGAGNPVTQTITFTSTSSYTTTLSETATSTVVQTTTQVITQPAQTLTVSTTLGASSAKYSFPVPDSAGMLSILVIILAGVMAMVAILRRK